MNTEDSFDHLFRDKFKSAHIDFNEEHWKQAEQLIIAKEKKDRSRKMTLWFSAASMLLCGFLFWNSVNTKQDLLSDDKVTGENFRAENKLKSENQNLKEFKSSEEINHIKLLTQNRKEQSSRGGKNPILKTNADANEIINIRLDKKKNYLAQINGNSHADINKTIRPAEGNPDNNPVKSTNMNTGSSIKENEEPVQTGEFSKSEHADEIPAANLTAKDITPEGILQISNPEIPDKKSFPKTTYSILAGALLSKAYSNTENESGFGVNLTGGVSIARQFNSTWSVVLNALYFEKGKLGTTKNFHSEYFTGEFGKRTEDINIRSAKLQYFSIPVLVQYHFNNNAQLIEAGAGFNYLINASSSVKYSRQITGSELFISEEKKNGYVNGFEKYDIGLLFGYGHHLIKNFRAGIRLYYGLKDITRNSYYNNLSTDKNTGVIVFLQCELH